MQHDRPLRCASALLSILLAAVLAGCGEDGASGDGDAGADSQMLMGCDPSEGDVFALGLERSGENVTVRFVSADPAPPDVGDNTWTVMITDLGGSPLEAGSVELVPFMPQHGHGTQPSSFAAEPGLEPGEFMSTAIDLFMPGLWEVTFEVTHGETTDEVSFAFCLEG